MCTGVYFPGRGGLILEYSSFSDYIKNQWSSISNPNVRLHDMGKYSCTVIILRAALLPDRTPVFGQSHCRFWLLKLPHPEHQHVRITNW